MQAYETRHIVVSYGNWMPLAGNMENRRGVGERVAAHDGTVDMDELADGNAAVLGETSRGALRTALHASNVGVHPNVETLSSCVPCKKINSTLKTLIAPP